MVRTPFAALEAYRLEKDWSWADLAKAMRRAGTAIPPRTLQYLCKQMPQEGRPHERTLHKVQKFLLHIQATDAETVRRAMEVQKKVRPRTRAWEDRPVVAP